MRKKNLQLLDSSSVGLFIAVSSVLIVAGLVGSVGLARRPGVLAPGWGRIKLMRQAAVVHRAGTGTFVIPYPGEAESSSPRSIVTP